MYEYNTSLFKIIQEGHKIEPPIAVECTGKSHCNYRAVCTPTYACAARQVFTLDGKTYIDKSIRSMPFSQRARACLNTLGIHYMSEVLKLSSEDLLYFQNDGQKTLNEILVAQSSFQLIPSLKEQDMLSLVVSHLVDTAHDIMGINLASIQQELYVHLEHNLSRILFHKIASYPCVKTLLKDDICSYILEYPSGDKDLRNFLEKFSLFFPNADLASMLLEELIAENRIYFENGRYFVMSASICHEDNTEKNDTACLFANTEASEEGAHKRQDCCNENDTANSDLINAIVATLKSSFGNGFMLHSPIELQRFRKSFVRHFQCILPDDNNVLQNLIRNCGFYFEKKVYLLDEKILTKIRSAIDSLVTSNIDLVYYENLFS